MPFVPSQYAFPKGPQDAFNGETDFWLRMADHLTPWAPSDGHPVDPDLAPVRAGYGYEIRQYYKSPKGDFELFKGEQGQIVRIPEEHPSWAVIHSERLGRTPFVPMFILRCGSVHFDDRKWEVPNIHPQGVLQPSVSAKMPTNVTTSSGQFLRRAMLAFLCTLAASDMEDPTPDFYEVIGGKEAKHAAKYANLFCKGTANTGLIHTLNNPEFHISELKQNAQEISDRNAPHAGIYIRVVRNHDGSHEIVVGRTNNFGRRWDDYKGEVSNERLATKHLVACRNAAQINMYELCRLPDGLAINIVRLAEQTFMSLFESYFQAMLKKGVRGENLITGSLYSTDGSPSSTMAALRFTEIAKAAAQKSRWPGVTTRASSGVTAGHNFKSPLMEWLGGSSYERMLWIRQDSFAPDETDPKVRFPIAFFRRSHPCTTHWRIIDGFTTLEIYLAKKIGARDYIYLDIKHQTLPNGDDLPKEGDKMELVFEVRLDGERHSMCHCPLPSIGPFQDWRRAMSWAFRIEWQTPSGTFKHCYIRRSHLKRRDDSARGVLTNYAFGITVLRSLLREIDMGCTRCNRCTS